MELTIGPNSKFMSSCKHNYWLVPIFNFVFQYYRKNCNMLKLCINGIIDIKLTLLAITNLTPNVTLEYDNDSSSNIFKFE